MRDHKEFCLEIVKSVRLGLLASAQALAANLLETILRQHFDTVAYKALTTNRYLTDGKKMTIDDQFLWWVLTFYPVWWAYSKYYCDRGDSVPSFFDRHASVHTVSKTQYTRANAVHGLMLVTSLTKYFDVFGLPDETEEG
jgi:hypothetical protein